jgi:hypothetical protein
LGLKLSSIKDPMFALVLQLKAEGLPLPIKNDKGNYEYKFCDYRRWRADGAFPKYHLLTEVEGGLWIRGRHNRPASMIKDLEKYNEAAILGWRLLRFTPQQVECGEALETLKRFFDAQR